MLESEYQRKIDKLYCDMYEGDGRENPPMTARMIQVEKAAETISANLTKGIWILVGLAITVIGDIISNHLK